MRVTRQQHGLHHLALIEQAARLFRSQGLAGVGVAEIGRAAGLTHGAVYSHFDGKDELAAAAVRRGLTEAAAYWQRRAARHLAEGRDPLAAIVRAYLSPAHRDAPETGCVIATLGPEAARAGTAVGEAMRAGIEELVGVLAKLLADRAGTPAAGHRATALAMLSAMTGGLVLARLLAADPAASQAALDAAAAATLALERSPPCSPA